MADSAEFESDQFLKLLTDALQSGPGTPQWHEAVGQLRASGAEQLDEYRMIIQARERLESGQEYRTVRAGPGFTRKVMEAIDTDGTGSTKSIPTATIIAVLAGVVILGIVIVLVVLMNRGNTPGPDQIPAEMTGLFTHTIVQGDFTLAPTVAIAPEWRTIGVVPVKTGMSGLAVAPAKGVDVSKDKFLGGGLVTSSPIPANQTFMADATVRVEHPSENLLAQVFVSDDASFDDQTAQSGSKHELICWIQAGDVKVGGLPNDAVASQKMIDAQPATVHLVIRMSRQFVMVEARAGNEVKQLYSGKHELAADKPRYVGVRFKLKGSERSESVTVQSVLVQKP